MKYERINYGSRADWLEKRKKGIGASEISAVLGESTWMGPVRLWAIKTGRLEAPNLDDNERIQWGRWLEPLVLKWHGERTGRGVSPSQDMFRSTEHPWAQCTLDGWVTDGKDRWPIEVKTVAGWKAKEWNDGAPEIYRLQVQHQMLVTGAEQVTVCGLIDGSPPIYEDVARDERTIRKIIYHGERFWQCVIDDVQPEPLGRDLATVKELHPTDNGETVELPGSLRELVDGYLHHKAIAKAETEAAHELEAKLRDALGDAQRGIFAGGGPVLTLKTTHRAGGTREVKPSSFRTLRIRESEQNA